jgi:hypothetical protein
MPREKLPEDPESLEKWGGLPQNPPSKQALPPMTAGVKFVWALLLAMAVLIILALILQVGPS